MNVYDFDKTIYPTDCAIDFCFWCIKRHPKLLFTYIPNAENKDVYDKNYKVFKQLYKTNKPNFHKINN